MLRGRDAVETASAMQTDSIRRAVYLVLALVSGTGLVMNFVNSVLNVRRPADASARAARQVLLVLHDREQHPRVRGAAVHRGRARSTAPLRAPAPRRAARHHRDGDHLRDDPRARRCRRRAPRACSCTTSRRRSRSSRGCCLGPWDARSRSLIPPALVWPLGYLVWVLIWGEITDWYPYKFIDVGEHGYGGVLLNAVLVLILGDPAVPRVPRREPPPPGPRVASRPCLESFP